MTSFNEQYTTVAEFFAHKNVFITGGTGFLGTVLIEAILGASPDVGTIYVLVRDKYGSNAHTRIQRMLAKPVSKFLENVIYLIYIYNTPPHNKIFESHSSDTLQKVVPVTGELNEENFGMSDTQLNKLLANVNIIYHSAATIKFKSHLRTAIRTNLTGTLRTIEFAKRLHNLAAYVYLSTAFCNSNHRGFIQESVYPSLQDPYEMMRLAADDTNWAPTAAKEPDTAALIGDHPNTYTFTKQLAENLIQREMAGLPAGIVRPSVGELSCA